MPSWKKVIISGSNAELSSLIAPSITGSLQGTASFARTASFVTGSNVFGPFGSNSVISASFAVSASRALTSSFASTAGSSSFAGTAISASYAATASFSLATSANQLQVINKSGNTIAKGVVVHLTGSANSSDTPYITTASYESDSLSANSLGITAESIAFNSTGFVTTEGVLTGLDVTGFVAGQLVYLGTNGAIIGAAPQAPLHSVRLGQVVRDSPSNNGSIYVRIDNGYELGELHDVIDSTTTASYGDLLVKSGSVWTNSRQLTGSYGLTGSLTVTGSTTTDLVRITQTGTGNAFRVEDSSNPDNTPFLIDNVGNVMIGTTSSKGAVTIASNGADGLVLDTDTASNTQSSRLFFKNSGSFTDFSIRNAAQLLIIAAAASASVSTGTGRLYISASGDVSIGPGYSPSSTRNAILQLSGSVNIEEGFAYKQDAENVIYIRRNSATPAGTYTNTIAGQNAAEGTAYFDQMTAFGYQALYQSSGSDQTAFGHAAGFQNSGSSQTLIGWGAGYQGKASNQTAVGEAAGWQNTGSSQSAYGFQAGYQNSGSNQTAIGNSAGWKNTATQQTAVGLQAGYLNIGIAQTALGQQAGQSNIGTNQTVVGYAAGFQNSGSFQTAIGANAGRDNTGLYQTAVGNAAGRYNTGSSQTAVGYDAGYENTGIGQTATGYAAGYENTGSYQSAYGYQAGTYNSGSNQTATGFQAGVRNIGNNQTVTGYQAGYENTGSNQSAYGYQAGFKNSGSNQVAMGNSAGESNSGNNQTAIGSQAGYLNTGIGQTVMGYQSGWENSGEYQTAYGLRAGFTTTSSYQTAIGGLSGRASTSSYQTAIGWSAGEFHCGDNQTAVGAFAGRLSTGSNQTVVGYNAGAYNSGSDNTNIGYTAGYYITGTSGTINSQSAQSVFLGSQTTAGGSNRTNQIVIGYNASGIGSNSVVLGNSSILTTALRGFVGIGTTTPTASLHVNNTTTSASFLVEDSTNPDTTPFIIDALGNVGIGNTTPSAKLTVQVTGSAASALVANFIKSPASSNETGSTFIRISSFPILITGSGQYTDIEYNSGYEGPFRYGTYADTNIINGIQSTNGQYGNINFVTSGSTRMTVAGGTRAGFVGINKTTPNATLDVSGSTIISGSLTTTSSVAFKAYTSATSFPGTAAGYLAFDSSGNIITDVGVGGSPFPYTGSAEITGSLSVNNALFTSTTATANIGSTTIYSVSTSSYDGAWFEYTARSGSNARAGQIMAIDSGSAVNFTETTTTDFGSTSGLALGVYIVNGDMALTASATTNGWSIKTIVRSI